MSEQEKQDKADQDRSLADIRVLDLSRVLAGPWAAQNLADLGAEVIKIERPGVGDDTRHWGPPFIALPDGARGDSGYFASVNRGKKSVTVDISTASGQEIVRELAKKSDIVIENYKAGTLARYGLDYAALSKLNSRLVYCSITGFGQSGPYSQLPGYDFIFQGMGGIMSYTGTPEPEPGAGPMKVGVALIDILTGMYSSVAILAALQRRNRTGKGEYIDMALLDCAVTLNSYHAVNYFLTERVPARVGNAHPNMVPYNTFDVADGQVILAIGNDGQFESFCKAAGRSDLAEDPRYKTVSERLQNRLTLLPEVARTMKTRTKQQWFMDLAEANVPCGPIYDMKDVFDDPQVQHRRMKLTFPKAYGGDDLSVPASPMRLSQAPAAYPTPPPQLGQDTHAILTDLLGVPASKISQLRDNGVV